MRSSFDNGRFEVAFARETVSYVGARCRYATRCGCTTISGFTTTYCLALTYGFSTTDGFSTTYCLALTYGLQRHTALQRHTLFNDNKVHNKLRSYTRATRHRNTVLQQDHSRRTVFDVNRCIAIRLRAYEEKPAVSKNGPTTYDLLFD